MTSPANRTVRWPPHYRVSWGGAIGTPQVEQWSNTVRFRSDATLGGPGGPVMSHDQLQTVANSLLPVISGWLTDTASRIHNQVQFDYVKVNFIDDRGLQLDQNTVIAYQTPTQRGSVSLAPAAWYISYALTLRTGRARGRAHAGRIYPPVPVVGLDGASGYCSPADATGMATAFARVLYAMEGAFNSASAINDPDVHAIVASPGDTNNGKPALFERITAVTCDRVPDVMHSRTNQLPRSEVPNVPLGP